MPRKLNFIHLQFSNNYIELNTNALNNSITFYDEQTKDLFQLCIQCFILITLPENNDYFNKFPNDLQGYPLPPPIR